MSNYGNQPHYQAGAQSSKLGPSNLSNGHFDSGISDVFISGPIDSSCDRGLTHGNFTRPKFTFQGSLDDVENGDSGIMMGEDETFTDSVRTHSRSIVPMEVELGTSPSSTRSRSTSPKFMSDEENSKQTGRPERAVKRRGPRLPKKIVTSNSVGSDIVPLNPIRMSSRSASAQALSTESVSTPEISASPPLQDSMSASQRDTLTCSFHGAQNQRVPPIASDFSMNMQNLRKYMDLFIPDKDGDTGFHLAVVHGQLDVLDGLLFIASQDRSLQAAINEQNTLYQTALHLAAHTQQLDMMRKLLIAGAAIDLTDHKGNTPLHISSRFASTRVLDEITRYVPLQSILKAAQIRNNEGFSCVHVAAKNGNTEVLAKLKSLGVDINMQDLNCGKTALHIVAEKSSLACVQYLIETCDADVNRVTYSGCSPLHIAAGRGDIATVAYLISMGANPELLTDEGDLALDLSGSEQVLSFLTRVSSLKWLY